MSKRQKSLFAADFSAVAKSPNLLFASISLQQKSTNFLPKFVSKSKICCRNSRISTFDCRYNNIIFENAGESNGFFRLYFSGYIYYNPTCKKWQVLLNKKAEKSFFEKKISAWRII
jgi:hypothetical protein